MKIQTEDKVRGEGLIEPYIRDIRQEACNAISPILGDYPKQANEQFKNAVDFTKGTTL